MLFSKKNKGYLNHRMQTMGRLLTSLFLLGFVANVTAQKEETITLTIEVAITKYQKGSIYLALYKDEESFMKKSYKSIAEKVIDGKVRFVFEGIEKGPYAFSYFHDVNSNQKLDNNFLGIPKEPYGFSNNQKGRFGPPKFEKAKVDLQKDTTVEVTIK